MSGHGVSGTSDLCRTQAAKVWPWGQWDLKVALPTEEKMMPVLLAGQKQVLLTPSFNADIALGRKEENPHQTKSIKPQPSCLQLFIFQFFIKKMRKPTIATIPFLPTFSPQTV